MKLITKGNLAIIEYPEGASEPEFDLDANGVLFIFGYSFSMLGKTIRVAKRFETNLCGYTLLGRFNEAKEKIKGDFSELMNNVGDVENCVLFGKY